MSRSLCSLAAALAAAAALSTAACGAATPPAGTLRFKNEAPVWVVGDKTPLAAQPAEREYNRTLYHVDGFVVRSVTRTLDFPDKGRALDVNSLDEVPDSSWFTNRIGRRDMTVEEIVRGANLDESPVAHLPWTIVSAKVGGTAIGFVFEDQKGDRYLLKFDVKDVPEMETGAHMIGHRILWAAGYNVPQDYLAYVKREDLVVSPKATKKDVFGNKAPLTVKDLEDGLARVFRADDGRYRVLASRFLPGMPIGPYAREGKRGDDPNDRIAHERRRSLRGQVALFSWLGHTDLQEDNTLDIFRTDGQTGGEGEQKQGFVEHYLIDFGKAFGVMGYVNHWKTTGFTYRVDLGYALEALFGFGLWKRPWEDSRAPGLRGIAIFDAETYEPGMFRANSQYWPFEDADRFDGFWGAKLAMRFTKEQLAAAVGEAQYSDPRASAYMLETLLARQRKLGAYWFAQVSPLDGFSVDSLPDGSGKLCFDDLAWRYQLTTAATAYWVQVYGGDGQPLGKRALVDADLSAGGRGCVTVPLGAGADGYTIVELAARRADAKQALPAVRVHLAARDGVPVIVGLRRR